MVAVRPLPLCKARSGRPHNLLLCVFLALFAASALSPLCAAAGAINSDATASPYGQHAVSYNDKPIGEFSGSLSATHSPMVLFIFEESHDLRVREQWQRLVSQMSDAMKLYAVRTAYVFSGSPLGQGVVAGFGLQVPSVLFFDGILRPVPGHTGHLGKLPQGYTGELTIPALVRWVLDGVSPDLISRISTDEDLSDFFAKYPGFPEMPRVLYFPSSDYVGPVYKLVSQVYQADAVFGVVVGAFSDETKSSIAHRYGVQGTQDLPAMVVLYPQESGTADKVVRLINVTSASSVEDVGEQLRDHLPHCAIRSMEVYAATGDRTLVDLAQRRKMYVLGELARERVELLGDDADDPGRVARAGTSSADSANVIRVTDQSEWTKWCAQMRTGSYCLAVVAPADAMEDATSELHKAAVVVMKSIASEMRGRVHFVLLDAEGASAIAEYFDLGGNGFPDAVLLSSRSPRTYWPLQGAFHADNLVRFFLSRTQTRKPVGGSRYIAHMVPAYSPPSVASKNKTAVDDFSADL